MSHSLTFVLAFDITDDARRTRMSKFLESCGHRVQKSVFEVIATPASIHGLVDEACRPDRFDHTTDSFRSYPLCGSCQHGTLVRGVGSALCVPGSPIVV